MTGSDGLCAPLLSPQEGAAVVSGDAGEKAAAADPLFSCQIERSLSAEPARGSPAWPLHLESAGLCKGGAGAGQAPGSALQGAICFPPRRSPGAPVPAAAVGLGGRMVGCSMGLPGDREA